MGEIMDALLSSTQKGKEEGSARVKEVTVRLNLMKLFKKYIQQPGDVFTFEIENANLEFAQAAMGHSDIESAYSIEQVSATTYTAEMRAMEF